MSNRIFLNFCEYQFKGNYNNDCNFPNSDFVRTSLNNNIKRNNTQPSYKEDSKLNKGGKDNGKR